MMGKKVPATSTKEDYNKTANSQEVIADEAINLSAQADVSLNGGEVEECKPQTQEQNTQKNFRSKHKERIDSVVGTSSPVEVVVQEPKKKKYGWLGTVFLLVIIAVGIYLMVKVARSMGGDISSFGEVINGADWRYAIILLAAVFIMLFVDSSNAYVVTHATEGKAKLRTSLKVHLLGKYYDNITPFATGGQPMQIYYLHKKGISGGNATAIVLIRYFAQMFVWLLVGTILLATYASFLMSSEAITYELRYTILTAGWVGLIINMFLPVFVLSFVVFPRFAYKLTSCIIGLGVKMHIVKNKEAAMDKALKVVKDFRMAFSVMIKKPLHLVLLIVDCLISTLVSFALPYFVMGMLAGGEVTLNASTLFAVMALNAYATFAVIIIPTPGNSGVAETVSLIAFKVFLTSVNVWVVFVWRFVVYYIYIVIGIGISIFEIIRKFVRARIAKNKQKKLAGVVNDSNETISEPEFEQTENNQTKE
jgi:hypothetical protein